METREVVTGLRHKSIFVIHEGFEYEFIKVPLHFDKDEYAQQHFNPQNPPSLGRPLNESEQDLEAARADIESLGNYLATLTINWPNGSTNQIQALRESVTALVRITKWLSKEHEE